MFLGWNICLLQIQFDIVIKKSIDHNQIVLLQFIAETKNKSRGRVIPIAVVVGSSRVQNGIDEVMSGRSVATWTWTLQDIKGRVTESVDIASNYEYKNENAQIFVLPSVAKKKVIVASVASTETFSTVGPTIQFEVPTTVASIPGLKMGKEC
jgi:hypothetical protein